MTDTLVAYNEIDDYAVDYMRHLMAAGLIANGYIFTCSIEDLTPNDLRRFRQVHLFAGMGVWSYALRGAGWSDDRAIWSASCPCQPFSQAGKGGGFDDERHLWPAVFHLATALRPQRIVGEQVADQNGLAWLDLISTDLELADYTCRAVPLCSAGFGAADIRNRQYWVADRADGWLGVPPSSRPQGVADGSGALHGTQRPTAQRTGGEPVIRLADTDDAQRWPVAAARDQPHGGDAGWPQGAGDIEGSCGTGGLADRDQHRREIVAEFNSEPNAGGQVQQRHDDARRGYDGGLADAYDGAGRPGPLNGFWGDADWLRCRDGKWRPVEPGTFPLVTGATARMGRLRAFGNAINASVAKEFLQAIIAEDLDPEGAL